MTRALIYGILGSLFFAFTFIFNRSMNLAGGYWMWTGVLRYAFTLPLMGLLVMRQRGMKRILATIRKEPAAWFLWSTVGFGLFYLPMSQASVYGPSWFIAASWQLTIVAGVLLTPLSGKRIPVKNLLMSMVILGGVALLQISNVDSGSQRGVGILHCLLLIVIGAFSYPLGNRKMMEHCDTDITTSQRVFGMTLCSMPFWLVIASVATVRSGLPSGGQLIQSFFVALFSGVVATILFFDATNRVKHNARQLAIIEATQAGEVLFTLLGGVLFLGDAIPGGLGIVGIVLIVAGMIGNSLI